MRFLPAVCVLLALATLTACAHKPATPPSGARPAAGLKTNAAGIALIKESEGLRLNAYREGDHWLIGYGHALERKPQGPITNAEAERLLREDLAVCENAIANAVTVSVSTNEFSAMASLCYTTGWQAYADSTLVDRLNQSDRRGAADAFLMWTKATVNGRKRSLPHLEERRRKERALFLAPDSAPPIS